MRKKNKIKSDMNSFLSSKLSFHSKQTSLNSQDFIALSKSSHRFNQNHTNVTGSNDDISIMKNK